MGKIATWGEINSLTGTTKTPANKCPTKSEIDATEIAGTRYGSYSSNQCVQTDHIYKAGKLKNWIHFERKGSKSTVHYYMDYMPTSRVDVTIFYVDYDGYNQEYPVFLPAGLQSSDISLIYGISALTRVSITRGSEDDNYKYMIIVMDR